MEGTSFELSQSELKKLTLLCFQETIEGGCCDSPSFGEDSVPVNAPKMDTSCVERKQPE